jgi:hypothetical protein
MAALKLVKKHIRKMHIRTINLNRWFPPNDNLAAGMARLCILREDFLFELEEWIKSQSVPLGDEFQAAWRQLYFFRRMCVTVIEIRNAIETLSAEREFKEFLKRQPRDLLKRWNSFKKDLCQALDIIDPVRHEVSAHIKLSSIKQALKQMDEVQRSGLLQISKERPARTHYKFTDELLIGIMFKDIPPDDQEKVAKERVDKFIPGVHNILRVIDSIFSYYAGERGLK